MPASRLDADALMMHGAFVRAVARAALGGDDEVEDVVQDTWQAALNRPPPRPGALRAWLAVIARRQAIRRIRTRQGERRRLAHLVEVRGGERGALADPARAALRIETGRRLAAAVLALPERYRMAVILRYHEDLPPREVAKRLEIPVETARTHVRRGLALLRERLEAEERRAGKDWRALLLPLVPGARPHVPAATTLSLGGVVVMKKLLLGGVALVLLTGAALWWRHAKISRDEPSPEVGPVARNGLHADPDDDASGARLVGREPHDAEPGAPAPPPVDLAAVDRDRDLHGIVVDPGGVPVAGATLDVVFHEWVHVNLLVHLDPRRGATPGPKTVSATDGTFALRLQAGDVVALRVRARGYAPQEIWPVQAGERLRVTMGAPIKLVVEARTPAGEPAVGLGLTLARGGVLPSPLTDTPVRTNAQGRAVFEGLPPGETVMLFTHALKDGWGHAFQSDVRLPDRGDHQYVLQLPVGRKIRGRITDASTDAPVAGASVGFAWLQLGAVLTDAEGRYVLPGWPGDASIDVHATAPGYARGSGFVDANESLDIALSKGAIVKGRLVDEEWRAVAGALLCASASIQLDGRSHVSLATGTSDAEGRFELGGLDPIQEHVLVIKRRGRGRSHYGFGTGGGGQVFDLGHVFVPAPCMLQGTLTNGEGVPLPRVEISLSRARDRGQHRVAYPATLVTDDLGRFCFVDLEPTDYVLTVGPRTKPLTQQAVHLTPDASPLHLDLELASSREVEIRVLMADGEPVPDQRVDARAGERYLGQARTDEHGVAVLDLPREPITVSLGARWDSPFVRTTPKELAASENSLAFRVERRSVLTGRLLDPDGEPLAWAEIHVELADGGVRLAAALEGGVFRVGLPVGARVDVRFFGTVQDQKIRRRRWRPLAAEVLDLPSDAKDVVLRAHPVDQDRRLTVRVVGPEGKPIAGVELSVLAHGPGGGVRTTDADGRVELEGLAALRLGLRLQWEPTRARPWRAPPTRTVVPEGEEVTIELRRGEVVEGVLLNEDGAPARRGTVAILVAGTLEAYARCDDEGGFLVVLPDDGRPVGLRALASTPEGQVLEALHPEVRPAEGKITLRLRVREPPR